MREKSASKQLHNGDVVAYKIGEECLYWTKFGEYVQQQATEDGWLDAEGRLTLTGFQAIISEQAMIQKRAESVAALTPKRHGFKGKIKIKIRGSNRKIFVHSAQRKTMSAFIKEIKALLAKINGKFIYFTEEGEGYRLVVRIPNEKGSATSCTLIGTVSDIKRELDGLIGQYD